MSYMKMRFSIPALVGLAMCGSVGCGRQDQIHSYSVPKQDVLHKVAGVSSEGGSDASRQATPARMLAAIVPHGDEAWFFKVMGDDKAVADEAEAFEAFLQSVRFNDRDRPEWTLPDGWRDAGAAASQSSVVARFATLHLGPEESPLELTVTQLPGAQGDPDEFVLANVNRWRGQLQLPPIALADLAKESKQLDVDGQQVTVVDLFGTQGGMNMGGAPFAGRRPSPVAPTAGGGRPPEVTYATPEGWKTAPPDSFSRVALAVERGGKKARITVSALAAAAGALEPNINRWRRQVGLAPTTATEIDKAVKKIQVGKVEASYVELVGETETVLGVVAVEGNNAWFIKLSGDSSLAQEEKTQFEQFVKSLRFGTAEGDGDGN